MNNLLDIEHIGNIIIVSKNPITCFVLHTIKFNEIVFVCIPRFIPMF